MTLIVVPPHIKCFEAIESLKGFQDRHFFLADGPVQKRFFSVKKDRFIEENDILTGEDLEAIGNTAEDMALNWYKEKGCEEVLGYKGQNLGDIVYVLLLYQFIKVFKAVTISKKLLEVFRYKKYFLIDDDGYWAKSFKCVASGCDDIEVVSIPGRSDDQRNSPGENDCKNTLRRLFEWIRNFRNTGFEKNGILYSCALRFAKDIWDRLNEGDVSYYLRPVLSFEALSLEKTDGSRVKHILPGQFIKKSRRVCGVDLENIRSVLNGVFSGKEHFRYKGYDLWPILNEDIFRILVRDSGEYRDWIDGVEAMLKELEPRIILVEEDDCPFNRVLLRCANKAGINSIQIIHGLTSNGLSESDIISTRIAVPGKTAYDRLLGFGADKEKIDVIGAPHYEQRPKTIRVEGVREQVYKDFKLSYKDKIAILATQPFYCDENPFLGRLLSPILVEKMIRFSIRAIKEIPDVKLIIKLHPADTHGWFTKDIVAEEGAEEKVKTIKEYNMLDILTGSSLLLTAGSTVYMEALLLNVPVLLFDDGLDRSLEFMSNEYLDLNDENRTLFKIRDIIEIDNVRSKRMEEQKEELKQHFFNGNKGALSNLERVIARMGRDSSIKKEYSDEGK